MTLRGYRFAFTVKPSQEAYFLSNAGAARFAYNWCINEVKNQLDDLHSGRIQKLDITAWGLRKRFNAVKSSICVDANTGIPWWQENSKEAYAYGCTCAATAFKNFFDSKKGKRKGRPVGFPRYKNRKYERDLKFAFTTGIDHVVNDNHHLRLPKLGLVRVKEPILKRVPEGTHIMRVSIKRECGRWYAILLVKKPDVSRRNPSRKHVGVDLGVKHLVTLSDGTVIDGVNAYRKAKDRLAKAQHSLSRKTRGSKRWRRQAEKVRRLYYRTANIRRDQLEKLTKRLATRYSVITIEDLNVSGMIRNHRLALVISDQGFGEFRRLLGYKCEDAGGMLVVADRFFPSSKTCSVCGSRKDALPLSERTYVCEACGSVIDRDLNAAINLDRYGMDC